MLFCDDDLRTLEEIRRVRLRDHRFWLARVITPLFVPVDEGHDTYQLPALVSQRLQLSLLHVPVLSRRELLWKHRQDFVRWMFRATLPLTE